MYKRVSIEQEGGDYKKPELLFEFNSKFGEGLNGTYRITKIISRDPLKSDYIELNEDEMKILIDFYKLHIRLG